MLGTHTSHYLDDLRDALAKLDQAAINAAIELLMDAWREGRGIYLIGNGGSAATASHMMTDLNMIAVPGQPRFRALALTDNVPLITAWSNDAGYAHGLVEQLRNFIRPGDVLIAISCSGNSRNVLAAVDEARARGAKVLAFTGDVGGQLKAGADIAILAPHPFIGAQEDIHLALDHLITSALRMWIGRIAELASRPMKALILAAGEGTRLRPLTLDRPKPMVPVQGKPVLQHIIEWLAHYGVRDVAINLHYKPEAIVSHVGDGAAFGIQVTYSREDRLMGSAGAAKKLEPYLGEGPFVVAYGDVLTDLDLRALLAVHHQMVAQDPSVGITLGLYRVPDPTRVGIVGLNGRYRVNRFVEKPKPEEVFGNLANTGVMIVEPHVLGHIPPDSFYDFGQHLLPDLLAKGVPVCGWTIPAGTYLLDIGSPERYALAEATFGQPHV